MRYFIHLSFDGGNYRGWQRQETPRNTVQEVVEQALSKLFKKEVSVYGCGRTDAGVHASQYVMQVDLDEPPSFDLKFRLNKNLPKAIAVFEIFEVEENQHCRHNATARTYEYFIHWNKNPMLFKYSAFYEDLKLDFDLMRKAAALILETTDFKPLCKQPELHTNTMCRISESKLYFNAEQGRLRYKITGNRFLRGMVRICVYFLLEVGKGRMTLAEFDAILKQQKKAEEKHPVHPNGLFLTCVKYPFLTLAESQNMVRMMRVGLE